MSELCFLPAQNGDAFFLHCQKGAEEGWIVVDGGPLKIKTRSFFLREVERLPQIDLMVLTHHDEDHINGILAYVNQHKEDVPFPVKKLWVNCARQIDFAQGGDLSPCQASGLAEALSEIQKKTTIEWKDYITNGTDTSDIKFADIDVLSPDDTFLKMFIEKYEKRVETEISGLQLGASDDEEEGEEKDLDIGLNDLALRTKETPNKNNYQVMSNMASIAFVLRCDGLSVLMLGDSFPQQIEQALKDKGFSKENKLKVDFVKVAHHGSRHNISNDLLDMIDCENYLIATDGGKGKTYHPNRETLANIICHPERDYSKVRHLHFNYTLKAIANKNGFELLNAGEEKDFNFIIHEPIEDAEECLYRATRY